MAETTQILFNSPALHSLKRDQLVKLCKIHSIKASGKNVELIEKLKLHAQKLPKDSPLSIAARSENPNSQMDVDDDEQVQMPRPSEQWEVMDSIQELDETSQGTLSGKSTNEFGTGGSKSSTVSSSIKAFASSLGLKRTTSAKSAPGMAASTSTPSFPNLPPLPDSTDELLKFATPYSAIPVPSPSQAPQTDHFTFTPTNTILKKFDFDNIEDATPLPGHSLRPGAPAPENARLSLGMTPSTPSRKSSIKPTTTMRLVSNPSITSGDDTVQSGPSTPKLKPFHTSFDLVLGTPTTQVPSWPPNNNAGTPSRLYPTLPPMSSIPRRPTTASAQSEAGPSCPPLAAQTLSVPQGDPFIFGSPNPKHRVSNSQFRSAAASVLEEMNKRLQEEGVKGIDTGIIVGLRPGASAGREIKPLRKSTHGPGAGVKEKFEKMHQEQFSKMEGIDRYLSRKATGSASSKNQLAATDQDEVRVGTKRKSTVFGDGGEPRRPATQKSFAGIRVISNGRRKACTIPGGFGDEEEEEEAEREEEQRSGKRPKVDFAGNDDKEATSTTQAEKAQKLDKDRQAIRKKLEANRARRRSSGVAGRASMGRGRTSIAGKAIPAKAKPSRFGFLSTAAKSIVKGVWGSKAKATITAVPPTLVTSHTVGPSTGQSHIQKPAPSNIASSQVRPIPQGQKKRVPSLSTIPPASNTIKSTTSSLRPPSNRVVSTSGTVSSTTSSSRSRSPIPSFTDHPSSMRTSASTGRNSSVASRDGPVSRTSSSRVSSLGTRKSIVPSDSTKSRFSTSSRLLAPTASSLAKMGAPVGKKGVATTATLPAAPAHKPLEPITNTSPSQLVTSPRPLGIFSKPLVVPIGSGIPSPVRKPPMSDTAPATTSELTRQRSASGRRPRISRSKVIAKLASQRIASASSSKAPRASGGSRVRSSLGANLHRKSLGGGGPRRSHAGDAGILLSAKKRARQSEYARRKSRAVPKPSLENSSSMDVDG